MKSISLAGHREGRINVLQVIGNAGQGGMENYIENFISHLPANQFKLTCICPYESPFTASLRQLGVEEVYITPILDDPAWRSIQLTMEVAGSCKKASSLVLNNLGNSPNCKSNSWTFT